VTLDTFDSLLSPTGQSALAAATALTPTDRNSLQAITGLRKQFPAPLAAAAVESCILRAKAAAKFRNSERMYFTREALEVSSGEVIAAYRAERFRPYATVGDFGCGIGGDTLSLAADGRNVVAVELDPVRARMAEANAAACGMAVRVQVRCADLLAGPFPVVDAVFADPGRRSEGQRFLSISHYLPPPGLIVKELPPGVPAAFKLAPGINRDEVAPFGGELEFISVNGELKESVLWLGELRTAMRRATLLARPTPGGRDSTHTYAADTLVLPDVPHPVGAFLFDPAAALVRAELEGNVAAELGLHTIGAGLAVFTGDSLVSSPFLTAYRVEAVLPLDAKKVNAHLTASGIGRVTVVQCGSGVDADAISRKCKGKGSEHRFVVLTREAGRPVAVVAERGA
jgi:SAM-dependent methyltransferase